MACRGYLFCGNPELLGSSLTSQRNLNRDPPELGVHLAALCVCGWWFGRCLPVYQAEEYHATRPLASDLMARPNTDIIRCCDAASLQASRGCVDEEVVGLGRKQVGLYVCQV